MSLKIEQIEGKSDNIRSQRNRRKKMKKWRNRKIRRVKNTEVPHIKFKGWEY